MQTRRPQAVGQRPLPRLYLIVDASGTGDDLPPDFDAALTAGDVAAVLVRFGACVAEVAERRLSAALAAARRRDVAFMSEGDPLPACDAGVDGVHAQGLEAVSRALDAFKPGFIVGAGGLKTRHDAMVAAEAGADYVMFGEPEPSGARAAFAAVLERVAWWAELFEPPCVGYAETFEEAAELGKAGADFVAVGDLVWSDRRGAAAALADVTAYLRRVELAS